MLNALFEVMMKLSYLPMLGGLRKWVSQVKAIRHNIYLKNEAIQRRKREYRDAINAVKEFPGKVKGSKKRA